MKHKPLWFWYPGEGSRRGIMSFCELKTAFLKVHEPGKGSFLRTRARSREPKNGFPPFLMSGLESVRKRQKQLFAPG